MCTGAPTMSATRAPMTRRVQIKFDVPEQDRRMMRRGLFGAVLFVVGAVATGFTTWLAMTGRDDVIVTACLWVAAVTAVGVAATAVVLVIRGADHTLAARASDTAGADE